MFDLIIFQGFSIYMQVQRQYPTGHSLKTALAVSDRKMMSNDVQRARRVAILLKLRRPGHQSITFRHF